jgi:DNA-cytosine methyltransferase
MVFGSVCSGIEAASVAWKPLGWNAAWVAEVGSFPNEVLTHHYPTVPNLGDMTKLHDNETFKRERIDILVGGTPCQAFSSVGFRKGLNDPRGNLTLQFLKLVDVKKPKWVVWENVPGVLSDKTNAFGCFLDGLEELGYVVDVDILDAQFFGLAQQRRRVFVCGQSVESLLNGTTVSSSLTIAQCLVEILHGLFLGLCEPSVSGLPNSGSPSLSEDGVRRRMRLFKITGENQSFGRLQNSLIEAFQKSRQDAGNWGLPSGASEKERIQDDRLTDFATAGQFLLTGPSLSDALDESFQAMKSSITSTLTNSTNLTQIFSCMKAVLLIGKLTCRLRRSSPPSWQAGLSFLTAMEDFTDYARQADREILEQAVGVQPWSDFIREADHLKSIVGHLGGWRPAAEVLFESGCLSGNFEPGARQEVQGEAQPTPACGAGEGGEPISFNHQEGRNFAERGGISNPLILSQTQAVLVPGEDPRRFTLLECEKLMGFPPGYTAIPTETATDSARYKVLGDSMAVPVMRWIGERIAAVDGLA